MKKTDPFGIVRPHMVARPYRHFLPSLCISGFLVLLPGVTFAVAENDSGVQIFSPQDVRSKVNMGGPESWPSGGISTAIPTRSTAPSSSSTPLLDSTKAESPSVSVEGAGASGVVSGKVAGIPIDKEESKEPADAQGEPQQVIYVDEQGNPVPKPPEPDKMLAEAERLLDGGKYNEALPVLEELRNLSTLSREMREKVLYHISDTIWTIYADNPLAGYEPIDSSTKEALNANLRSPRVPDALLRLGLANCNVGNLTEGRAYMKALLRRYPDHPGVAQGFTALGQEELRQGKDSDAERSFALVLDDYPESSELQSASVGLAKALYRQGQYNKTRIIMDFINKRWPRYYIDDPAFLVMQAGNEEALKKIGPALDTYWLYVNLEPQRTGNDALMLKMGDLYLSQGKQGAADFVYTELNRRFPESQAAITGRLRLAERGIYESPLDYDVMSKVFAQRSEPPLWQIYCDLADSSNTVPEAVQARVKKAMWLYWDKQYTEAMAMASEFIDSYPDHVELETARDIIWMAFEKELDNALSEENYGRILILWNGFPLVRERYGPIDADLRYALAKGWQERGKDDEAFELLGAFLQGPKDLKYGEAAFSEFFNRYLQVGAWQQILDLAKLVEDWDLKPELRKQLDYAMALSAQNLNLTGLALALWKKLAVRDDIPLYQRAYATYFLANDAENRKDIRDAYLLNKKVITMFRQLQDEQSDKADPERIKESMAALMDICEVGNRIPEALEWLKRYSTDVSKDSSEYPGLRFREARLYRKLGDSNRAQAILEDIVRNHATSPYAQAATGELRSFDVSRDLQSFVSPAGGGSSQRQLVGGQDSAAGSQETP